MAAVKNYLMAELYAFVEKFTNNISQQMTVMRKIMFYRFLLLLLLLLLLLFQISSALFPVNKFLLIIFHNLFQS